MQTTPETGFLHRLEATATPRFAMVFVATLLLLLAAGYTGGLSGVLVFDDEFVVIHNQAIHSLGHLERFWYDPFTHSAWRNNGDLRPLVQTTFALNYAISGLQTWSYHLFTLLVHALCSALVFVLVRDHVLGARYAQATGRAPQWLAAASALWFALAPVNSQPVLYVSARSALLCTVFCLGATLAWLRQRHGWAAALYGCALLCKAIALTLPLAWLAHDYLYRDVAVWPTARAWLGGLVRRGRRPAVLLGSVALAYLTWRSALLPAWLAPLRHDPSVTPGIWLMTQWSALLHYVHQFVWPDDLALDNDVPYNRTLWSPRTLGALAALLCWLGWAAWQQRRQPWFAFASLWFFVTLAPESTLAPLGEVVNDHRPYIASSLGLSVLVAGAVQGGLGRVGLRRPSAVLLACLVLAWPAVLVLQHRSWLWQDARRIWQSSVDNAPDNPRAAMNAGLAYLRAGDLGLARPLLQSAADRDPNYPFAFINLSALEVASGQPALAVQHARQAVRLASHSGPALWQLAQAQLAARQQGDAVATLNALLAVAPQHPQARQLRDQLAPPADADAADMAAGLRALDQDRLPKQAQTHFQAILRRTPGHYGAHFQLARALSAAGERDRAAEQWRTMRRLAEAIGDQPTLQLVYEALAGLGQTEAGAAP